MAETDSQAKGRDEGRPFGKYVLLRHLRQEGNFIEAFVAHQPVLDRHVEVRILRIPLEGAGGLGERFLAEVKTLARFEHPSILRVLDFGVEGKYAYYSTPLIRSARFRRWQDEQGGRLDAETTLRFGQILSSALAVMHGQGLLHRGISEHSVYMDTKRVVPYFGECSVLKDVRANYGLSARGVPTLSDFASAPEEYTGEAWSERTDVYQMCAFMYRMLTGDDAIPAGVPPQYLPAYQKICPTARPPDVVLAEFGEELGLRPVILAGLSFDPASRPSSAAELDDELQRLARRRELKLIVQEQAATTARQALPPPDPVTEPANEPAPARSLLPPFPSSLPPRERPLLWLGGALGGILVLVGVLGYALSARLRGDTTVTVTGARLAQPQPPRAPLPVTPPPARAPSDVGVSLDPAQELLQMRGRYGSDLRSERSFRVAWRALQRWVGTQPGPVPGVGGRGEVAKIYVTYVERPDEGVRMLSAALDAAAARIGAGGPEHGGGS